MVEIEVIGAGVSGDPVMRGDPNAHARPPAPAAARQQDGQQGQAQQGAVQGGSGGNPGGNVGRGGSIQGGFAQNWDRTRSIRPATQQEHQTRQRQLAQQGQGRWPRAATPGRPFQNADGTDDAQPRSSPTTEGQSSSPGLSDNGNQSSSPANPSSSPLYPAYQPPAVPNTIQPPGSPTSPIPSDVTSGLASTSDPPTEETSRASGTGGENTDSDQSRHSGSSDNPAGDEGSIDGDPTRDDGSNDNPPDDGGEGAGQASTGVGADQGLDDPYNLSDEDVERQRQRQDDKAAHLSNTAQGAAQGVDGAVGEGGADGAAEGSDKGSDEAVVEGTDERSS
ncbi:hypothetical protein B0T14DRAFT_529394 [Immersiella caudata]|uniref:Uncharacterized protein n=1 Tax=Immersiella caudata TaxID=314043 RepID=A0AA39T1E2_9PEZI|nr:hypothetical protein B0T14DRAFT_529394 [Immersiella caudata]